MEVHIGRAHGTGEPVKLDKPLHEEAHSPLGTYKTNVNNDSFNRIVRGTNSPGPTRAAMNTISKSHKILPGRDIIDHYYYRAALEIEENSNKIKKIKDVFGEIPFSVILRINAEFFNFSSEITSEPPAPPFQKNYSVSPVKSNTVNDSGVKGIMESTKTTQEKPKRLTFDEYRKMRPGLTFEEYRKIRQTPVGDREYSRKGWVRRNLFGEYVAFGF
jgi:hypothetical protein